MGRCVGDEGFVGQLVAGGYGDHDDLLADDVDIDACRGRGTDDGQIHIAVADGGGRFAAVIWGRSSRPMPGWRSPTSRSRCERIEYPLVPPKPILSLPDRPCWAARAMRCAPSTWAPTRSGYTAPPTCSSSATVRKAVVFLSPMCASGFADEKARFLNDRGMTSWTLRNSGERVEDDCRIDHDRILK